MKRISLTPTILCAALFLSLSVNQALAACSGTCIDTTQCANKGGTSTAGLCPGAANIQCCTPKSCTANGQTGTCKDISTCSGTKTAGLCPGPYNIQCCTSGYGTCSVNGQAGTCKDTAQCTGTHTPGYCPGPSNIQCCTASTPSSGGGSSIVTWGRTQVGKVPYSWGGGHGGSPGPTHGCCSTGPTCGYHGPQPCPASSTTGFDCSGFTRWAVWKARGSDVLGSGGTSGQEARLGGKQVTRAQLQPGDLIFYGPVGSTYHTAIYVGSTQLEAPETGQMVSEKAFRAGDRYYRV
ncbi:hypothetical protein KFL_001780100 [Klebsormidium nitens]|uniref:NlpC/P60 domain-containing protein n=1 Tax=Klebsormidium nitens TaxID=105231 RepID=A0A1Y1HZS0_KLENI|nr:hypothetical protein KFL_001780100 [Klebsormidium nitens]|eukprot:GAQ84155.1 hypothetical protein KFL_001780100 [Klebsormidium nitens]